MDCTTYFDFYLAEKKKNKYHVIGPCIETDGEYHVHPLLSIQSNDISKLEQLGFTWVNLNELKKDDQERYSIEMFDEEQGISSTLVIPLQDLIDKTNGTGIINTYIKRSSIRELEKHNYMITEMPETRSAGEVAEMGDRERKKCVRSAFVDITSAEYFINRLLNSIPDSLIYDREYFVLCDVN